RGIKDTTCQGRPLRGNRAESVLFGITEPSANAARYASFGATRKMLQTSEIIRSRARGKRRARQRRSFDDPDLSARGVGAAHPDPLAIERRDDLLEIIRAGLPGHVA